MWFPPLTQTLDPIFLHAMRRTVFPIVLLLCVALSTSLSIGAETPRDDSTHGVSHERLMEFWDAYTITSMHYGDHGVPSRIVGYFDRLDSTASAFNAAMGFIEANQDIFKVSDAQTELVLGAIETDSFGGRTVVLQQMCQGLNVVNGHLDFAITPYGSMEVFSGRYFPDVQVSVIPQIDSITAIGIVRDSLIVAGSEPGTLECGLCILPRDESFLLVWQIDQPDRPERAEPIFVNAQSGEIIPRGLF